MLPDVQPQNGNALHISNALRNMSRISHATPTGEMIVVDCELVCTAIASCS